MITRRAHAGGNRVPVHGRFRGATLKAGRYRLGVMFVDPESGAKSHELRTFRIRR